MPSCRDRETNRDLHRQSDPLVMHYVRSITDVLASHLGWHRARLKFMARFTAALLKLRTTNLWELAVVLKAGVKETSNYRRIRRFLSDYEVDFVALGQFLVRLLPQSPPYTVVLDRTEWHFGSAPVNVLVVGIAHKGIAFPISWTVLPEEGSSSASEQQEVLRRFFAVVDRSDIEVVVGDREFIATRWLRWLQEKNIPFAIRLRSDRRLWLSPEGPSLPARMFARPLATGTEKVLNRTRHLLGTGGKQVEVRVVMRRISSRSDSSRSENPKDQFLILATSGIDPEEATTLYEKRWEIETMFAALKSRGYNLEKTRLTAPGRIRRLIGLLALAFAWTSIIGERRAYREGPPREKSHGRRQRSLFRYGLDRLRGILNTPKPQPAAFLDCLRGLRSPTAFLSCT